MAAIRILILTICYGITNENLLSLKIRPFYENFILQNLEPYGNQFFYVYNRGGGSSFILVGQNLQVWMSSFGMCGKQGLGITISMQSMLILGGLGHAPRKKLKIDALRLNLRAFSGSSR